MLVCNVSLRPPRRAIAADLAEDALAIDLAATGNVVFATLVDDPASVRDTINAYLGEVMVEAASVSDTWSAAVPTVIVADVAETVTAATAQDATTMGPLATLDGTATNVTLSGGNLIATHSAAATNSGVRSTANKTSGKYYFEFTYGTTNGGADCVGIILSTGTYNDLISVGSNCTAAYATANGIVFSNNGPQGDLGGNILAGHVISMAVDFSVRKAWFRRNGGTWSGGGNPATGTGGYLPMAASGSFAPVIGFGGSPTGNIGDNISVNFGQSAFVYAAPSGFGNWTA